MALKDQAIEDLSTFLNVDEFGDAVDFDGASMACVLEGAGDTQGTGEDVINRDTIVRTRASSFAAMPVVGQRVTIDGDLANVVAVDEDQGIVEIRLRWLES